MKILYVVTQYPKLSETFVLNEVAQMRELGHEPVVCAFRPPNSEELPQIPTDRVYIAPTHIAPRGMGMALGAALAGRPPGGDTGYSSPRGPWRERFLDRLALGGLGPWIASVATRERADWIHAHFAAGSATAAWSASSKSGIPFGFTAHAHGIFFRTNALLRAKTMAAALPVTISEFHRRHLVEKLGAEAGQRFEIVRCGVDLETFRPSEKAPSCDIGAVGRLVEMKGFDVLIRALALLPEPRPSCEIVGEGPDREKLQSEIQRLGLGDTVRLRGSLSNAQTREFIQGARIFALPCVVAQDGSSDGLPVVLMEALALGKPAVSTAVAGIPELIEDGVSGLMACPKDERSLAGAIERLIGDQDFADRLAIEGRNRVERLHDVKTNTARLASLIEERLK